MSGTFSVDVRYDGTQYASKIRIYNPFKSEETVLVNTGPAVTNCERCIKLSTGYIQELGGVEVVTFYEALFSTVCVWGLGDGLSCHMY